MQLKTLTLALPLLLGSLLAALPAEARLGGDEASVYSDAQALATQTLRTAGSAYTRIDLNTAHGVIHEYLTPAGVVFAVTFGGGPTPSLDILLGSYMDAYKAGQVQQPGQRRNLVIDTPTLRAVLSGRPYAISGRIWLPTLTPANVTVESLQ